MQTAVFASIAAIFAVLTLNSVHCSESCSTYGEVRLVQGSGKWEGNVQVCMNNTWGYVCDNSWGSTEARGVCYQLGYTYSSSYVSTRANSYFGSGDGTVHLDNLYCYSVTTRLVDCSSGAITCDPYKEIAGVECRGRGTCTSGEVRLTANSASYGRSGGRVEICQNSNWGTVCRNPSWGNNNTDVVCRQLGFEGDNSYTYTYVPYGFGSTNVPIRLRSVDCEGDENSLLDCDKVSGSTGCTHSNDAGVRCSAKDTSTCTNGAIRLWSAFNDTKPNEGMAQICRYGRWYGMCHNYYSCHIGRVVCQSLGYSGAVTLRSNSGRYYGFYDNMDNYQYTCYSSHTSISQCSYYYTSWSCGNYNDGLGVICSTSAPQEVTSVNECTNGDVRLVNGTTSNEGRVEYCYNGLWSPMCSLGTYTAKLVCKKLGFKHYNYVSISYQKFGISNTPSVFNYLYCSFWHSNLSDCSVRLHSSSTCYVSTPSACTSQYGLTCFEPTETCTSGDVRLVGGLIEQEGRTEVCVDGYWGAICDDGWGRVDAYVFCKTLGYEGPSPNVFYYGYFGNAFSVWSYLYCRGWESNITQCTKTLYGSCSVNEAAGVRCRDKCISGDIKLVGGQSPDEGSVQVCYNNLWGQISGDGWTDNDAKVVCRYLGYRANDATAVLYSKYNLTVHYQSVDCQGTEYSLSECAKRVNSISIGRSLSQTITKAAGVDCVYTAPTVPPCISATPTGPSCTQSGSFRLIGTDGATSTTEGRVEYCNGQFWTPLCTMDNRAAQVACRQLGHTQYSWGSVLDSGHDYGTLQNYSLVINISCAGDEASLSDCTVNTAPSDCLPLCINRNIGLKCFSTANECDDGSVRLVDGLLEHEGRAEICLNGVWGSICDDQWDHTDGHVFCQQLGHPVAEAHIFTHSWFGGGDYPIVYSGMNCRGWESSVSQCEHNGYRDTTCSRDRVAGVLCGYNCSDGDVRLVDGPHPYEGTVEVCFSSIWGLVDESGWSLNDAKVVCSQLGYGANADDDIKPRSGSYYGKTNKTVHVSGLQCEGTEDSLLDCIQTTYSLEEGKKRISFVDVAGVRCSVPSDCETPPTDGSECLDGDVRLSGIRNEEVAAGRLEYCHKGYWTSLCAMDDREAVVACRELGYYRTQYASIFTRQFSGDLQVDPIRSYVENITCSTGKENDISQCLIIDGCQKTCRDPIEIKCYEAAVTGSSTGCDDGSVRLVDGQTTGEGRVEICYNNVWGSVCGNGFDFEAATVTCNQLGLEGGRPVYTTNSSFSDGGQQPILISDVKCKGLEDSLKDCQKSTYMNFKCSRKNLAGVKCKDDCGENRVRLVGGKSLSEGTVEVCYNGDWGLIASNGWTNEDAVVVCSQLGYSSDIGVISVTDSRFGKTNRSIVFSEVDCSGLEASIFDCDKSVVDSGENLRRYVNVSGVSCLMAVAPTTDRQTGTSGSKDSSMMIAIVFLVICLAISIIIIISILVIAWLRSRSSKSPDLSVSSHTRSSPTVTMSSVNPISDDDEFTKDTITESPSFDEKILPL